MIGPEKVNQYPVVAKEQTKKTDALSSFARWMLRLACKTLKSSLSLSYV